MSDPPSDPKQRSSQASETDGASDPTALDMARPDQSAADQQASRSALENQPTLASVPDARGHSREETISGDAPTMLDVESSAPRPRQRSLIDDVARAPKDFPSAPALKSKKSLSEVVEAEKSSRPPLKRRLLKWTKRLVILLVLGALLGVLAVVGTVEYYSQDLPSVADLRKGYDPPQVTKILAKDGTELASLFTERRTVISLDKVPDHVKLAFLAAEDARFYEHEGLNYVGMLRALAANLRAGKTVQGGSTITQQVVKNLLLDSTRSYERKIRETILARRLEQYLSKDEIFSLYLNHIYLGHGRYGVEEAARFYFGKPTKELNLTEAVALAGLVASPEHYSPRRDPEKNAERRRYVLGQMLQKQFIKQDLYESALAAPLHTAPSSDSESELAPEVVAQVKSVLAKVAGARARRGGYVVKTSIDPRLQAEARKSVRENLDNYMKRQKLAPPYTLSKRNLWGKPFEGHPKPNRIYTGVVKALNEKAHTIDVQVGDVLGEVQLDRETRFNRQRLPPSGFTKLGALMRVVVQAEPEAGGKAPLRLELGPQSALVAIDPKTRQVVALVGGYDAIAGGLDRATRALRQPASSFKPFVYSYALHSRRMTPATLLELPGDKQHPEGRSELLRTALAKSDNEGAREVFRRAGPANVVEWAKAVGIQSEVKPDMSAALGAYEVTPIELCNAYTTFASGGEYEAWKLITEITDPSGKKLPLPEEPPKRRVMEPAEAYLITSLMTSVVKEGTGRRALALGRAVAGKTGTSNQARDTWFAGFSTELVAVVWTGYDDNSPMGWGEQGAVSALPAWVSFMKAAHAGHPKTEFIRPPGIVVAQIDPATGKLAYVGQTDAVDEEFLDGTVPTETADAGAPDGGVSDGGVDAGAQAVLDAGTSPPEKPEEPPNEATPPSGRDAGVLPEPDAGIFSESPLGDAPPPF